MIELNYSVTTASNYTVFEMGEVEKELLMPLALTLYRSAIHLSDFFKTVSDCIFSLKL